MQIIQGGNDAFNALMSPNIYAPTPNVEGFMDKLTDVGRNIYQTSSTFIQDSARTVSNMARTLRDLAESGHHIHPNMVYTITNIENVINANHGMRRWIMSHPDVKSDWLEGLDTYTAYDPISNAHGIDDYDYRRVYDNVVVEENNQLLYRNFSENIFNPMTDKLSIEDKNSIITTHRYLSRLRECGVEVFDDQDLVYF